MKEKAQLENSSVRNGVKEIVIMCIVFLRWGSYNRIISGKTQVIKRKSRLEGKAVDVTDEINGDEQNRFLLLQAFDLLILK